MTSETEDNLARAREQGQAQFDSIVEMCAVMESTQCARGHDQSGQSILLLGLGRAKGGDFHKGAHSLMAHKFFSDFPELHTVSG
jgi:hypothetical protein